MGFQRYGSLPSWMILITLGLEHCQGLDQFLSRVARLDHSVHKAAIRYHVGIRKAVAELFNLLPPHLVPIPPRPIQSGLVPNSPSPSRSHPPNSPRGPGHLALRAIAID